MDEDFFDYFYYYDYNYNNSSLTCAYGHCEQYYQRVFTFEEGFGCSNTVL